MYLLSRGGRGKLQKRCLKQERKRGEGRHPRPWKEAARQPSREREKNLGVGREEDLAYLSHKGGIEEEGKQ